MPDLKVPLSEEGYANISRAADAAGLTKAAFVRERIQDAIEPAIANPFRRLQVYWAGRLIRPLSRERDRIAADLDETRALLDEPTMAKNPLRPWLIEKRVDLEARLASITDEIQALTIERDTP